MSQAGARKDVPSMSQPVVGFVLPASLTWRMFSAREPRQRMPRTAGGGGQAHSLESKEPDKILRQGRQGADHSQRLENRGSRRVIEHKSNQAANKVAESRTKGNVDAVRVIMNRCDSREAVRQVTDLRVRRGRQVQSGREGMEMCARWPTSRYPRKVDADWLRW